jgi:hypothetical protein
MITANEIRAIRERIDARAEQFRMNLEAGKDGTPNDALASLKSNPGWAIAEHAFEEMICELLERSELNDSPEMYILEEEAKRLTIQAIQSVLESVDGAATAKIANGG